PAPCKPGQERNPATNRCRNITAASSSRTACDAGQERNPETNRCRKIAEPAVQAPCKEGYERNTDTNRCRKITAVKGVATNTPSKSNNRTAVNYLIIGGVSAMVLGYAAYEYRQDIRNTYSRFKNRNKRVKK